MSFRSRPFVGRAYAYLVFDVRIAIQRVARRNDRQRVKSSSVRIARSCRAECLLRAHTRSVCISIHDKLQAVSLVRHARSMTLLLLLAPVDPARVLPQRAMEPCTRLGKVSTIWLGIYSTLRPNPNIDPNPDRKKNSGKCIGTKL